MGLSKMISGQPIGGGAQIKEGLIGAHPLLLSMGASLLSGQGVGPGLQGGLAGMMQMQERKRLREREKAEEQRQEHLRAEGLEFTSGALSGLGTYAISNMAPMNANNTTQEVMAQHGGPTVAAAEALNQGGFDFTPYAVGGAASRPDSFTGLNPDMQQAVASMLQAADAELGQGALKITSAYRSPELQGRLYEAALKKYGSPEAARKWVAPPGRSQHNHGTAIDFAGADGGLLRDANSREAQWIARNASRFGLDVPMNWEPWQVELAGARGGQPQQAGPSMSPDEAAQALHNPYVPAAMKQAIIGQFQPQQDQRTALLQNIHGLIEMGYPRAEAVRLARGGAVGDTAAMQTLKARAQASGLQEGTPAYQDFMRTGGKAGTSLQVGADGSVSFNDGVPVIPGGQSPMTTNSPRDGGKLAQELSKGDAATLNEVGEAARTATQLESLANQLEVITPQLGYTGPGGGFYGAVDDMVGFLPGDSGARGAFKSLAMEAQLSFTEKTKGAITDREMAMFKAAVPNLGQTPEANRMISQVMQAGAQRVQARAAFFENWARVHGSLEGAQEVWGAYMRDNPLLAEGSGGLTVNPEGGWNSYLNRKPAMSYTPEGIMQMGRDEVGMVPIERLTGPQIDALERRMQQLGF
ncbi:D-alanyl-D-alanine carboxypeptidase family protein [Ruegeria sp. 2012CJ41-6]|uniref:D-alanyl-D-alanine carboxypeptidase family protein n=1 Tax=Ruegeria spongiae TaxID=2942209 RepID=A0ABT0Q809_9RHOB|nr:D-alanyl-D-alanine carboxypeptidase family protein [Ruegeria spongiae]MCL6286014.1 D-alanyl-D-alanine carboxypeptidase family protein [Ruegeria spongiae]